MTRASARITGAAKPIVAYVGVTAMISEPKHMKTTDRVSEMRRPQMPVPPFPYRETMVSYENKQGGVTLAGTLTEPEGKGPFPAVILISGSGAQDRDETLLGHKPFLVLADYLTRKGIGYLGGGVSGGEEGARHGPSIMVGGSEEQWHNAEPVLTAIAAKYKGEPCCAYLGKGGAGHFVKTIHNGIEYGDMQMIAEVYGVMRDGLGMNPLACSEVFKQWNKGPLNSYLIEITGHVLAAVDKQTGKPLVELILDKAGQKGTGRWSAIAAQEMGVPATAIEGAVAARSISALKDERVAAEGIYGKRSGSKANVSLDDLEKALLAGKIVSYAQGFAVMAKASAEQGWNLPMPTIAKIWRAGCIIRSAFLDEITAAFNKGPVTNLLVAPDFVTKMKGAHGALRKVVAAGAEGQFPLICLSASLGYFDSYRMGLGTANLIQGQRDFFGAHGFEMLDRPGEQHGTWPPTIGQ